MPRADHLVVVEAHTAVGERAGLGLADVVEQRGQAHHQLGPRVAHHGDRVREHVLVGVDRILLEAHAVELGQELVAELGLGEEPQARAGVVDQQELRELVADALRAHDLEPVAQLDHCGDERGIGFEVELRDEARRTEHPQRVVEERDLGCERGAQATRRQVDRPAEGVDQHRVGQAQRHRVHGEVTPREVGLDVVGVDDLGLAALGPVDLGAERGDLEHRVVLAAPDRAEALSLEPDRIGPRSYETFDDVGPGVGGDVDVGNLAVAQRAVEERVAHAPADQVALVAGVGEQARELLHRRRRVEQRGQAGREQGHRLHSRPHRRARREPRCPSAPSRITSARSATVAPWTLHPPVRGWAATHSRPRCSRSTPASAWCGSIRSATAGAAPGCSADCTRIACRRPEGGTCSTAAAWSRDSGSGTRVPWRPPHR